MHMDERADPLICLDETNFNQCELMYACVVGESTCFEGFTSYSRNLYMLRLFET